MKRLALSLALITGIAVADTTDNLINQNGELDHNSTYYYTESSQTYDIPEDADWKNPSAINWSVDVRSFDNAVGCYSNCIDDQGYIKVEFYDNTNTLVDSTGPGTLSLDYDGGQWSGWVNYSGVYDNELYMSEIASIEFVVGGKDRGYWGGYYGPQFRDASLIFEYDPVEESLVIEVEQERFNLFDDLEHGHIGFDEFSDELTSIQFDYKMDMEEHHGEFEEFDKHDFDTPTLADEMLVDVIDEVMPESKDVKSDIKAEVKTKEVKREPSNSKEHNESSNSSDNTNSTKYDFPTNKPFTPNTSPTDGLKELQLLQQINEVNTNIVSYSDVVDFSSYTSVSMADSIELEDNEDWYQNQAFYESIGMSDSGILNGYNNVKLNDNKEWYGSNNQFY